MTAMSAKIAALLAKAERSDYEAEAASYLAKAQELMIRHAISESDLAPEQRERITSRETKFTSSLADFDLLAAAVGSVGGKVIRSGAANYTSAILVGLPSDLDYAQALYASLLLQRESALARAERPPSGGGRSFCHSFRLGYAARVRARLSKARAETVAESAPGTDLVLASKQAAAEQKVRQMFPRLGFVRSTNNSWAGFGSGNRAAAGADVHGGRNTISSRPAITGRTAP